jgi:hypothetical protein
VPAYAGPGRGPAGPPPAGGAPPRIAGARLTTVADRRHSGVPDPRGVTSTVETRRDRVPPTLCGLVIQQMRVRPLRPLPNAVGWLTKRGDTPPPGTSPHPAQNPPQHGPHALRRLRRQGPAAPRRRKTPRASASPHSSSGRRATGSCRPNMADAWPGFSSRHS